MRAKDIMTTNVITVGPDETVSDIARLMIERNVSAVPVVDVKGALKGIVSEGDLVHRIKGDKAAPRSWWLALLGGISDRPEEYLKSHGRTAADVMTAKVVTIDETASVAEIAELLETKGIKRAPVVEGGKLVGIVSRANILQALAATKDVGMPEASADDQALRDRVQEELCKHEWGGAITINVVVKDATVQLWGSVESEDAKKAVELAARNIRGVAGVTNHLSIMKHIPEYV